MTSRWEVTIQYKSNQLNIEFKKQKWIGTWTKNKIQCEKICLHWWLVMECGQLLRDVSGPWKRILASIFVTELVAESKMTGIQKTNKYLYFILSGSSGPSWLRSRRSYAEFSRHSNKQRNLKQQHYGFIHNNAVLTKQQQYSFIHNNMVLNENWQWGHLWNKMYNSLHV